MEQWTGSKSDKEYIKAIYCHPAYIVPWITRRSNQSILKEINLEYSREGLLLKLQYFGRLIGRANSLEKTQMLGKIEGGEGGNRG